MGLGIGLGISCLGSLAAQEMRDSATHDQLVESLRAANKENPMAHLKPSTGQDSTKVNRPTSIVSESDFLSFDGKATLVPKRAILHIPANLASRVKFTPGARLMTFGDFYAVNRAWVTTQEVSRVQAEGKQPLPEDAVKRIQKSTTLVIATYKGGPITVLPPKTPEAAPAATPGSASGPAAKSNTTVAKP